jgi:hypothetical protein
MRATATFPLLTWALAILATSSCEGEGDNGLLYGAGGWTGPVGDAAPDVAGMGGGAGAGVIANGAAGKGGSGGIPFDCFEPTPMPNPGCPQQAVAGMSCNQEGLVCEYRTLVACQPVLESAVVCCDGKFEYGGQCPSGDAAIPGMDAGSNDATLLDASRDSEAADADHTDGG